jgi:hypothetical protein
MLEEKLDTIAEALERIADALEKRSETSQSAPVSAKAPSETVQKPTQKGAESTQAASKSVPAPSTPTNAKKAVETQKSRSAMEALVKRVRDEIGIAEAKELITGAGQSAKLSDIPAELIATVTKLAEATLSQNGESADDDDDIL